MGFDFGNCFSPMPSRSTRRVLGPGTHQAWAATPTATRPRACGWCTGSSGLPGLETRVTSPAMTSSRIMTPSKRKSAPCRTTTASDCRAWFKTEVATLVDGLPETRNRYQRTISWRLGQHTSSGPVPSTAGELGRHYLIPFQHGDENLWATTGRVACADTPAGLSRRKNVLRRQRRLAHPKACGEHRIGPPARPPEKRVDL